MTDPFADNLIALLRQHNVPDEEIEAAKAEGRPALVGLFADHAFIKGTERLTRVQVAERAGIQLEEAIVFWRALGFADVPDDKPVFTEVDVDVLQSVSQALNSGLFDRELALQTTRVMGRSMAAVAAALIDTARQGLGDEADDIPATMLATTPMLVDNIEQWLLYIWRRHIAAEAKRAALQAWAGESGTAIVGFADLVGFSGISQSLTEEQLASAVSAFEATAVELVSRSQGRVIKMIGDEVMFEAPDPKSGCEIALDLVEAFEAIDELPDVRVGLAAGTVTRNQGDLFGEAPNLASRLVDEAYPGTLLVSDSIHEAVKDDESFNFRAVRPQSLKGFGRVKFWVLRRAGDHKARPVWKVALPLGAISLADRIDEVVEKVTGIHDES